MRIKITLLVTALIGLFAIKAQAQPGSNALYPYIQNFDTLVPSITIEDQAGWNVDLIPLGIVNAVEISAQRGINGTQSMSINLNDIVPTDSTSSPLIGPINANTTFGYSYRIVDTLGQPYTLTGNAGLKIQIKQDVSPNWLLLDSISFTNHVDSNNYRRIEFPIGSYAGMNVNFRFAFYQGFPGETFYVDIDSLVINHPTITSNKTSQIISSNYTVQITDGNLIKIVNNTLTDNNNVNIYDVNGKLVCSTNLQLSNLIDASQWNKGVYFVQINDAKSNYTQKIIVR